MVALHAYCLSASEFREQRHALVYGPLHAHVE